MLSLLTKYGGNVHSQNGEDFIVRECAHRMGLDVGHCVEAGGNDGQWMSNTRLLLENGWSGLFVEADYDLYLQCKANWSHNPRVRSQCSRVDGKNINAFVDDKCDLLSLDTDGSDFEIFQGLQVKPKIVIVEIDSSIPPNADDFNSEGGAGYWPMTVLGLEKGYFLLCHTGNLIFVDDQYKHLFSEVKSKHPLIDSEFYFNRSWLKGAAA